jgi:hypothetical protein
VAETTSKGGLHRSLGIPEDEKIPKARIQAATHSDNPKVKKQAILAETYAKHRPHGGGAHPAHHFAHKRPAG